MFYSIQKKEEGEVYMNFDNAMREAHRLAKRNPGSHFYVMKPVTYFTGETVVAEIPCQNEDFVQKNEIDYSNFDF